MNDTTIATVRTTWNTTLLAAITSIIYKVTGVTLTVDELLVYTPIIAPVIAVFYRLSRVLSDKWPVLGYVLFGMTAKPGYHQK